MSLDAYKKSANWEYPRQGNSWKQAIMNEVENLKKFDVFKIIRQRETKEYTIQSNFKTQNSTHSEKHSSQAHTFFASEEYCMLEVLKVMAE